MPLAHGVTHDKSVVVTTHVAEVVLEEDYVKIIYVLIRLCLPLSLVMLAAVCGASKTQYSCRGAPMKRKNPCTLEEEL